VKGTKSNQLLKRHNMNHKVSVRLSHTSKSIAIEPRSRQPPPPPVSSQRPDRVLTLLYRHFPIFLRSLRSPQGERGRGVPAPYPSPSPRRNGPLPCRFTVMALPNEHETHRFSFGIIELARLLLPSHSCVHTTLALLSRS